MTRDTLPVPGGVAPNPVRPPRRLGRTASRALGALVEAVVPPEPEVPDLQARLVDFVEGFVPYMPSATRRLFPVGLWLLEFGTFLFFFAPRRFSRLDVERRRAYLRTWQHGRPALRRTLFKGLRAAVMLGFYDLPEVTGYLGYRPGPYVDGLVRERARSFLSRGLPVVREPHEVTRRDAARPRSVPARAGIGGGDDGPGGGLASGGPAREQAGRRP